MTLKGNTVDTERREKTKSNLAFYVRENWNKVSEGSIPHVECTDRCVLKEKMLGHALLSEV